MFLLLALSSASLSVEAAPAETPNGVSTISDMRRDMSTWKGKLVAMRGRVLQVEKDMKDQPIIKLEVGVRPDVQTVWIASLISGQFGPGDDVLMLGLMTRVPELGSRSNLAQIIDDPFMIIGMCFANLTAQWGAGSKEYSSLCEEWFKRRMPDTPR